MIKKVIQLRGVMQTVCVTLTRTVMLNLGSDGCKPASEPLISCAAMGQASRAQHSVIPRVVFCHSRAQGLPLLPLL